MEILNVKSKAFDEGTWIPVQAVIPEGTPLGKSTHTYVFTIYILDNKVDFVTSSKKRGLLNKIEGQILQQATISGKFQNYVKKASSIALSVLLALTLIGCANQNNEPSSSLQPSSEVSSIASNETDNGYGNSSTQLETTNLEAILSSYYSGQSSRAFSMLKKSIFESMIDSWTDDDVENPVWNYDSFTPYYILDNDMVSVTHYEELYYCTFSSVNDKFGYIVMSYDGSSLQKINMVETPYLYDLQVNIDEIADKLIETEIDVSSAVASRVQLVDTDNNCFDEVIRITDSKGHNYMCYFGESSIDFIDHTVSP